MEDRFGEKTHPVTVLRPGVLLTITCSCDEVDDGKEIKLTYYDKEKEDNFQTVYENNGTVENERKVYRLEIGNLKSGQLGRFRFCKAPKASRSEYLSLYSLCNETTCQATCTNEHLGRGGVCFMNGSLNCAPLTKKTCLNPNPTTILCNGDPNKPSKSECELVASGQSPRGLLTSDSSCRSTGKTHFCLLSQIKDQVSAFWFSLRQIVLQWPRIDDFSEQFRQPEHQFSSRDELVSL